MRAVVYCGTQNLYADMVTAAKSLIYNNKVDKVYFLIENDEFTEKLPPIIETVNVSDQAFFRHDGANFHNGWTYMVLMKTALHRMFPNLDKVLCLDVDTIVLDDISELFDLNMGGYYVAGAKEQKKSEELSRTYINAGVMLMNLKKLRSSGKGDELIAVLNRKKYLFCEQDCISERCQGGILEISGDYNACNYTKYGKKPKIVHYAAISNWQKNSRAKWHNHLVKYRNMKWSEVLHD